MHVRHNSRGVGFVTMLAESPESVQEAHMRCMHTAKCVTSDDRRHSATWIVKSWQWLCLPRKEDTYQCFGFLKWQSFNQAHYYPSTPREISTEANHCDNKQVRI
jgi:hypothetical protein